MKIDFIEETHTYLNDNGIIIPSVSELIRYKFPEAYRGVPEAVLKKKASFGTKCHQYIEDFVSGKFTLEQLSLKRIDPDIKIAVEQYESLRKKWAFHIKNMEQIVTYKGKYAGRYDLLTIDSYIIDLKMTSEVHTEWLRWQLSLYYLALRYMGLGIYQPFGYCMWIPKGKAGQVYQIDTLPEEEVIMLAESYEKDNTSTK